MKIENFKLKIPLLIFSLLCFLFYAELTFGETMSNSDYILRWGNFNMVSGKPTNASYKVSYTAGQVAPGLYTGANFKVRSGFQYIYTLYPFSFSISDLDIDFGIIDPTSPVSRTNILSVDNQTAGGYVVTGYENHQLLIPASGDLIPDTSCDNGLCTETTSGPWVGTETSLTYGFGYRCDAITTNYCSADFNTADYYKQFADISKDETPQTIFSNTSTVGKSQQAQITYKVNVSSTQKSGRYSNIITYVATGTF
ncbi:hypothetical protein M1349_02865 [Patescibacteria group bacterium]|nr:hypothetical protein [Patescibacteria group bacterium]